MAIHIAGFGEDQDGAGAEKNIAALADQLVETSGDNLVVPALDQVLLTAAGVPADTALESIARINTPSMLRRGSHYIAPLNGQNDGDVEPGDPSVVQDLRTSPLMVRPGEEMQALITADSSAAAFTWVLLWFSNGIQDAPTGQIFTTRATGTTTQTARAWTDVSLSFSDRLPVGRYAVVGMRAEAASCIAARLLFRGSGGVAEGWRPGCIGNDTRSGIAPSFFRWGGLGNWGEFHSLQPPIVQYLSDLADTAQTVYLDLVLLEEG